MPRTTANPLSTTIKLSLLVLGVALIALFGWLAIRAEINRQAREKIFTPPDVSSLEITRPQQEAIEQAANTLQLLEAEATLAAGATSVLDTCYTGNESLKGGDLFAWRCEYRTTKLFGSQENPSRD